MSQQYITGLDIGTGNIKAVVTEVKKDGQLSLVKVFKSPSAGLRKGIVDDLSEVVRSLNQAFGEIKKVSKNALKNIYLNIGGADIHVQSSRGIVAISKADYEIYQDDIDRAVQASQAINLPPNRMVLHAITREFVVDGVGNIRDPMGMIGNKLEVDSFIIDAFSPAIKNLTKCVETAGAGISGLIFGPIAASGSVLSKNQRELGVAMVDIGFSTTGLCVFEENKILHSSVLPLGASNITNDLAIGLKISVEAAELAKLSFGFALAKGVSGRETVDLKKIDPNSKLTVTKKFIAEIVEMRLAEIFEFVNNELKLIGRAGQLPAGVVLVGGGAKLPGIVDLAKQELKLAAQIGIPDTAAWDVPSGELNLQIEDPEFACAAGLVFRGSEKTVLQARNVLAGGFWKKIINNLLP
jgi:cell division protein FtsA